MKMKTLLIMSLILIFILLIELFPDSTTNDYRFHQSFDFKVDEKLQSLNVSQFVVLKINNKPVIKVPDAQSLDRVQDFIDTEQLFEKYNVTVEIDEMFPYVEFQ